LYTWLKPTFSLGVSQKINKVLNLSYIKNNGFSYVRRITGGKTVLHDDEITYSIVSSEKIFFDQNDLYKSYLIISRILVNAFKMLDIPASLHKGGSPQLAKSNLPCFSFPTPHENEIKGKKIVGSAQKRDNTALLQHGSIPLAMNYERYARGTYSRAAIIARSMTTLGDSSRVTREDLMNKITLSLHNFVNRGIRDYEFSNSDLLEIRKLKEKYKSKAWNYLK